MLYESQFGTERLLGGRHRNIICKDSVSAFTKIVAHAKSEECRSTENESISMWISLLLKAWVLMYR